LAASSSTSSFSLGDLELARLALFLAHLAEHAAQLLGHLLHAGGPMISRGICSARSISISLSSSWPSRSFLRKTWRAVGAGGGSPPVRAGGISTSRMRSFGRIFGAGAHLRMSDSRVCLTATSARSRMMESTSLPT
jgi:hypothetical protein